MGQDKTVIFVHIPKTAGRTLEGILQRQYAPGEIYDIYGYGSSIPEKAAKLWDLAGGDKRRIRLIKGHYPFGLHDALPQPCTYITLLRDPVERVISYYYYVSRDHDHPLHHLVRSQNMSLKDVVLSGVTTEVDNGQTRLLSGLEKRCGFGQCDAELLARAKRNLQEHFAVAGLVERFDESLVLMKLELGWASVHYSVRNVSKRKPGRLEISEDTLRVIRGCNELDAELCRYVEQRFDELIAQWEPMFRGELRRLRRRNFINRLLRSVQSPGILVEDCHTKNRKSGIHAYRGHDAEQCH